MKYRQVYSYFERIRVWGVLKVFGPVSKSRLGFVFKKKSNFTLLEMVLAIAIFAMMMLTIGTGMFSIQQTWSKMSKKNKMINMYQILDRVFDTTFRNCIPFTWADDNFQQRSVFAGNNDECVLAYSHRITSTSGGGIRFLKLSLKNGNLIAAYSQFSILYWNENKIGIQEEVLATGIKTISFLYASREDNEIVWLDDWDEENNQNIPLAIQVTVGWNDGTSEQWLRRTAGAGKFESYGKRVNSNEI
jgi:hypothetical protein